VIPLPKNLQPERKYFWAVDAIVGSEIHRGDVWMFSVAEGEAM